jgi:adenylylsulfate kinase
MVIWIVGLSGAGKTTIGKAVYEKWRQLAPNTVLLDGDQLRQVFAHDNHKTDYSIEGRRINAQRAIGLCHLLDSQGINVVCCLLSIFEDHRQQNRNTLSRYFEVFVDVPMAELIARDDKGLYRGAVTGETKNVVGVDIPFDRPQSPDLVIENSHQLADIKAYAEQILEAAGVH